MPPKPLTKTAPKISQLNESIKTTNYWTNSASIPIKKVDAVIPISLIYTMKKIERTKFSGSPLEFGLYLSGDLEDGVLFVNEKYYLPKQEVSSASIDFDSNDDGGSEYNGVIHRHPGSMHSFSSTDDKHINSNFMFSLLYADGQIKTGVINLNTDAGRVQLKLDIDIETPNVDISHMNLDNIEQRVVRTYQYRGNNTWRQNNYSNINNSQTRNTNNNSAKIVVPGAKYDVYDIKENKEDKEDKELIDKKNEAVKKFIESLNTDEFTYEEFEQYATYSNSEPYEVFELFTDQNADDLLDDENDSNDSNGINYDGNGYPFFSDLK